jgi:hypothetical protein
VCPYCGHDYRIAMGGPMLMKKKESAMPTVGGILILLGALAEIGVGAAVAFLGAGLFGISLGTSGVLAVCGGILLAVGVIALLGAIFAIQRRHFGLAVLGGILSMGGFFIFGLIGLILVAVSRDEFTE